MFGYINVNRKELSEENQSAYQSYYCGLCQSLKEHYGAKGQVLLNYDMTFLVVLLTGLYENENKQESFICALHPTKKRTCFRNETTDYAAAMNVLLAYHNLVDDWKDEHNYTKRTMANALKKSYDIAAQEYPRQVQALEDYLEKLEKYEKAEEHNIDLVAGLTGEMLGELFAWKQDEWYNELKTLGYYMGKFIYLMMTSMISESAKSFERLPILLHADILRNILYSGVWSKYEYIQLKKKKRTKK